MNTFEIKPGQAAPPIRYHYEEYPKKLFSPEGEGRRVANEEQEKALREQGWSETKPVNPSVDIQIVQQPRTGMEMVALREAQEKYDKAYRELANQYEELYAAYEERGEQLAGALKQIEEMHAAKASAKPAKQTSEAQNDR
jgi:hypothetical protein